MDEGEFDIWTVVLPALGVAFGAFCVWLTVRIVNRRERWAKWTLAGLILGLPVLYVGSFGPVCWAMTASPVQLSADDLSATLPKVYLPIGWGMMHSRLFLRSMQGYARWGMATNAGVHVPVNNNSYILIKRLR